MIIAPCVDDSHRATMNTFRHGTAYGVERSVAPLSDGPGAPSLTIRLASRDLYSLSLGYGRSLEAPRTGGPEYPGPPMPLKDDGLWKGPLSFPVRTSDDKGIFRWELPAGTTLPVGSRLPLEGRRAATAKTRMFISSSEQETGPPPPSPKGTPRDPATGGVTPGAAPPAGPDRRLGPRVSGLPRGPNGDSFLQYSSVATQGPRPPPERHGQGWAYESAYAAHNPGGAPTANPLPPGHFDPFAVPDAATFAADPRSTLPLPLAGLAPTPALPAGTTCDEPATATTNHGHAAAARCGRPATAACGDAAHTAPHAVCDACHDADRLPYLRGAGWDAAHTAALRAWFCAPCAAAATPALFAAATTATPALRVWGPAAAGFAAAPRPLTGCDCAEKLLLGGTTTAAAAANNNNAAAAAAAPAGVRLCADHRRRRARDATVQSALMRESRLARAGANLCALCNAREAVDAHGFAGPAAAWAWCCLACGGVAVVAGTAAAATATDGVDDATGEVPGRTEARREVEAAVRARAKGAGVKKVSAKKAAGP